MKRSRSRNQSIKLKNTKHRSPKQVVRSRPRASQRSRPLHRSIPKRRSIVKTTLAGISGLGALGLAGYMYNRKRSRRSLKHQRVNQEPSTSGFLDSLQQSVDRKQTNNTSLMPIQNSVLVDDHLGVPVKNIDADKLESLEINPMLEIYNSPQPPQYISEDDTYKYEDEKQIELLGTSVIRSDPVSVSKDVKKFITLIKTKCNTPMTDPNLLRDTLSRYETEPNISEREKRFAKDIFYITIISVDKFKTKLQTLGKDVKKHNITNTRDLIIFISTQVEYDVGFVFIILFFINIINLGRNVYVESTDIYKDYSVFYEKIIIPRYHNSAKIVSQDWLDYGEAILSILFRNLFFDKK